MSAAMIQIAPGVEYNCVAREWRCKWSDDNNASSLKIAQKLLDEFKNDILSVTSDWVGKQVTSREVFNGKIDTSKMLVQRAVDPEQHDFKVIIKLPVDKFEAWEKKGFAPEGKFLSALGDVEGISCIETQTYTISNVNLMGKIQVPSAAKGCMQDSIPQAN
ncbi:unnamed protein product [Prorocentrum cordatum]|uniref:Uncharacterized protein n=1 Tax=Prorocentrum cordatum TaxID=2364126 RepID=A0ABN9SIM4_9DINO|nr:unnamed protein product [Polarella glacialis]